MGQRGYHEGRSEVEREASLTYYNSNINCRKHIYRAGSILLVDVTEEENPSHQGVLLGKEGIREVPGL